jgi:hypothetical protein
VGGFWQIIKARMWQLSSLSSRTKLLGVILLGVALRTPFWRVSLETPLDGDSAIVGLMAQRPLASSTFLGQPYGSPLDGWIAAPFVALCGPSSVAVRLPYFLLGLALIPLTYWLAAQIRRPAALIAALLVACPPAYFMILSALPPPLYSITLVLCTLLLAGSLWLADHLSSRRAIPVLILWGLTAGLAVWTHLISLAILLPCAAFLLVEARRNRWRLAWGLPPLLLTALPLLTRLIGDPSALVVARVSEPGPGCEHLRQLLPRLHEPILALVGGHVPVTADDPGTPIGRPWPSSVAVSVIYVLTLFWGLRHGRAKAWLLAAAACSVLLAFPWPLRSGPETIRFLSPAFLPLAAIAALGISTRTSRRMALAMTATLLTLNLSLTLRLLQDWRASARRQEPAPACQLALEYLLAHGIDRAWAPYELAHCLTFSGAGHVVASQPWNERFLGYPLPYLDELRFAHRSAWILPEAEGSDLPSAQRFGDWLRETGGRATRSEIGSYVAFRDFAAPFNPEGRAVRSARETCDGRLETKLVVTGGLTLPVPEGVRVAAVTLVGSEPPLPRGLTIEASRDGGAFTEIGRLRPNVHRSLMWANGQPQPRWGQNLVAFGVGQDHFSTLRVIPMPRGLRWSVAEILMHETATAPVVRNGGTDPPSWTERCRALTTRPQPSNADWYFRMIVAQPHCNRGE